MFGATPKSCSVYPEEMFGEPRRVVRSTPKRCSGLYSLSIPGQQDSPASQSGWLDEKKLPCEAKQYA
jgi:hypothetical protein